jgi:hypothetical protein
MKRLFRNIRKQLAAENKAAKYLRYAVGEILLVVIGILIALQVNNWNQEDINSGIEKKLLLEIKENLSVNEKRLKLSIDDEYQTAKSIEYIVSTLENRSAYNDSMDYHFGRADFASDIVLTSTAFETIKSKGFDIISSDDIRKSMIDLFDSEYGVLLSQTIRLEDQFWPSESLPKFHRHFRINKMKNRNPQNSSFGATPVNYDALLNDTVYINMIKHRGSFRYHSADLKESAYNKTTELKEKINNYLLNND